jgi:hypothetical protein
LLCVINCGDGICGSSGDGGDDGGGSSGDKSEQTHYSQQVDLLQKALLLLPCILPFTFQVIAFF